MNEVLAMIGMLLAGGVIAGLAAMDIRRHRNREQAALQGRFPPPQKDKP